ncbi:MAG: hypothetical protein M1829_001943 [Trizodia sp. TS-e1964]|nr:MAG: hypothetical protein M1829_001943 [Trizodia sp. TS-e1964]
MGWREAWQYRIKQVTRKQAQIDASKTKFLEHAPRLSTSPTIAAKSLGSAWYHQISDLKGRKKRFSGRLGCLPHSADAKQLTYNLHPPPSTLIPPPPAPVIFALTPATLRTASFLLIHPAHPPISPPRRPVPPFTPAVGQMSKKDCDEGWRKSWTNDDGAASLASKRDGQTVGNPVAPFLAQHLPNQYGPFGLSGPPETVTDADMGASYCYRHRPDMKCRRQADEPTMDQLQNDLQSLSQSDQRAIATVWSLFSAAPSKHRTMMLQGILAQCCFSQLSYLSASVRDLIRIDFVSALPFEISFKILSYLDTISLCKAAQVSHRWKKLADDDVVWHKMCEQHIDRKCDKCGWGLPLLERKRLLASRKEIQLRANGRALNMCSPELLPTRHASPASATSLELPATNANSSSAASQLNANGKRMNPSDDNRHDPDDENTESSTVLRRSPKKPRISAPRFRPWKEVYKDRFRIGTNWKYGRYSLKIFKGHTNGIMCLQFDDKILATGSYDSTIKIWDIQSGQELRTLRGHESGIRALKFDETKLISGSIDRSLKVWNWRTGECLSTYRGHGDGVVGLDFDTTIVASGSKDSTVKIWNFHDKSTFQLRGHRDWVNAVKIDSASRTIFSASDDFTVRLWDLDTKSCIRIFRGHVGQVQQVLPLPPGFELDLESMENDSDDGRSFGSSSDADPADMAERSASPCLNKPYSFEPGRPLPPKYMLTGALDSQIRLWDVSSGKCLRTFFGHVEGIWALAADTLRMVSGSEDRMVKVWDARTGRCLRTFTGHAGPVTCLGLSDSTLCTGSEDCQVRMYSFSNDLNTASSSDADDVFGGS